LTMPHTVLLFAVFANERSTCLLNVFYAKPVVPREPAPGRGTPRWQFPMKAIAKAFGVSRSNLLEQRRRQKASKTPTATERPEVTEVEETAENGPLLARIRELVGERPSYGYRRVTALLNRERTERVNPKRIYKIMRRNELLLERCTGDGRGRKHDGVIVTLKPDLRWCSDSFEIRCWSGERVFVSVRPSPDGYFQLAS